MPKLPELIEGRKVPTPRGGVVAIRPPSYEAEGQLARGLGELLEARLDQQDRFAFAVAESELARLHVASINSLAEDQDYNTYVPRYEKQMEDAIKDASQSIRSNYLRQEFELRARNSMARGAEQAFELSKKKERDVKLGELDGVIAANREAAITAQTEEERAALVRSTSSVIKSARDAGYLSAEEAARRSRLAAEDYAIAAIETMPPEKAIEALKNKDGVAQYIPADKRNLLEERANSELASRERAAIAASKEAQQQLYIEAANAVEKGGVKSIPPHIWETFTPAQRNSLRSLSEKDPKLESDPETYQEEWARATADPEKWAETFDLGKARANYSKTDAAKLESYWQQVKKKDPAAVEIAAGYESVTSIVNGRMRDAKISKKDAAKFRTAVDRELQARMQAKGTKRLDNDEVRSVVDTLLLQGTVSGTSWYQNDDFALWQMDPEDRARFTFNTVKDVNKIPLYDRNQIRDALKASGRAYTDELALKLYNENLRRQLDAQAK